MSEIRDLERGNVLKVESIKRRAQREIDKIQENHAKNKIELKENLDNDLLEVRNSNQDQITKEIQRKEQIISELRTQLNQSKNISDKQLKELKETTSSEKMKLQEKNSLERDISIAENEIRMKDLNDRYKTASEKVNFDGRRQVEKMKEDMHSMLNNEEKNYQNKMQKQAGDFNTLYKKDSLNFKNLSEKQKKDFKDERFSTNLRQSAELTKMTNNHADHLESLDNHYRKSLKDQDVFFEKKFVDQIKQNDNTFKTLEDKNKNVISDLKSSLTKEITKFNDRSSDPFYKFESLNPKLKEFEDKIEVNVEVPEHSKQDLNLSLNGKEVVLTFNRRYSDASKTENGTINKVNKVESFTTRLKASSFLDPKSVKSQYENGFMTYTIMKS